MKFGNTSLTDVFNNKYKGQRKTKTKIRYLRGVIVHKSFIEARSFNNTLWSYFSFKKNELVSPGIGSTDAGNRINKYHISKVSIDTVSYKEIIFLLQDKIFS